MEVARPVTEIHVEIARKVLAVNEYLTALEGGTLKIGPTEEGVRTIENFLSLLLELEMIFYPELQTDKDYQSVVAALDLYRFNKEAYAEQHPTLFVARYLKGTVKTPILMFHSSKDEIEATVRKGGLHLASVDIYPSLGFLRQVARVIVELGLRMDILRMARNPAPVIKFWGDVDEYRGEAQRAIEQLRNL